MQTKKNEKPIFLMGFMGSGKTTLGRSLAKKLGSTFIDLDHEIERIYQQSIPDIFRMHGEAYFRQIEALVLRQMRDKTAHIIATGGGTPCQGNNMAWIKQHGISIYLQLSPKELLSRLNQKEQASRPLLQGKSPDDLSQVIEEKLAERKVYYEQADYTVNGFNITPSVIISVLGW